MAIKYKNAAGVDQQVKINKLVHDNINKVVLLRLAQGGAPLAGDAFVADTRSSVPVPAGKFVGASLKDAYAYIKKLPEFKGAVDV